MFDHLIRKAKATLTQKKTSFEAEEAQLQAEEAILIRFAALEQRVDEARASLRRFETEFGEFCSAEDPGLWFAGELPKLNTMGASAFATLCVQVAAHDAAVSHKAEILEGCRKAWIGTLETDLAAYRKEHAAVIKKYANAA